MKDIFVKNEQTVKIIGANVQIYGHFEVYKIPYSNGNGIHSERDVTIEEFLELVDGYYNDKKLCNFDYGDDLSDQNRTKNFIIKRINDESFKLGKEWLEHQQFK